MNKDSAGIGRPEPALHQGIPQRSRSLAADRRFVAGGSRRRPQAHPPAQDWRQSMKAAIRDSATLLEHLGLAGQVPLCRDEAFPTFVPPEFLARIRPGDPDDPLLRQVLAVADEEQTVAGFAADPVGDLEATACQGLLQKYDGRALMITTAACGIHCRYCFRREFPYGDMSGVGTHWNDAIDFLSQRKDIDEVLLSGGDPLTLTDDVLGGLLDRLNQIEHVRRIRLHSRMPIVIPSRVTPELVSMLRESRATSWMVVHCNHASEIDGDVEASIAALVDGGIPVLNQAVLLRGVNDDVATLETLCRRMIDLRVQPYYLHQLDRVRGAAHFEVSPDRGQAIVKELRKRLPGYAVPTYVQEQCGAASKTPIADT
ncbi:EF-P beta-lysylation protein EpmB [Crateriforma conspicua]|uniref:L-lysine 2,3-aminomutase n=1 Tax=Crateriforma conspicua TaxID=2527996 RepID=A0A5C5Y3K9_9PLAN|nr:EF-P beta-lysylation protein EpmB [Crateriforma conspicua]QDV64830.1 L-lysine 2,3-aminomutase [Crateriforma conspicua]TWT70227.1 L-lysine 2,3-aminomutase [Crateriforma conspicua]